MRLTNMSSTNISILQLCQTLFFGFERYINQASIFLAKSEFIFTEVAKNCLVCDDERIGNEKNTRVEPMLICVSVCNCSLNVGCFYNWLSKKLLKVTQLIN